MRISYKSIFKLLDDRFGQFDIKEAPSTDLKKSTLALSLLHAKSIRDKTFLEVYEDSIEEFHKEYLIVRPLGKELIILRKNEGLTILQTAILFRKCKDFISVKHFESIIEAQVENIGIDPESILKDFHFGIKYIEDTGIA